MNNLALFVDEDVCKIIMIFNKNGIKYDLLPVNRNVVAPSFGKQGTVPPNGQSQSI
jgi:hypothetical protein